MYRGGGGKKKETFFSFKVRLTSLIKAQNGYIPIRKRSVKKFEKFEHPVYLLEIHCENTDE